MTQVPIRRDLAVMKAQFICRRTFLQAMMGMAAAPLLATSSRATTAAPVLLGRQLIPLNSGRMSFAAPSLESGRLFLKTAGEGYWLDQVAVTHGESTRQVISVGRRLLPGKALELVLAPHSRGPVHIDLRHTYCRSL